MERNYSGHVVWELIGQEAKQYLERQKDKKVPIDLDFLLNNVFAERDNFELDDARLVFNGDFFIDYDKVILPVECVKEKEQRVFQSWKEWNHCLNHYGKGLLSFPLFYSFLDFVFKNKDENIGARIKHSFQRESGIWFVFGTKLDYGNDCIVHSIKKNDFYLPIEIPKTGRWNKLSDVQESDEWIPFLKALTGKDSVNDIADVLNWASCRNSWIYTSGTKQGERAVFAGFFGDGLLIGCGYGLEGEGCARSVHTILKY